MTRHPQGPTPGDAPSPLEVSDDEIRAIAERLVQEACATSPASGTHQILAQRHELSPADEERVDAALVALGAVPPESTMRAAQGEGPIGQDHEQLASAVAATRQQFLLTELSIGHTILDAAAGTQQAADRARRIASAQAAHDEVARRLARDEAPAFTDAERESLASGLVELRVRLDDAR